MHTFLQIIVDFIFPPSVEELQLREISPETFVQQVQKSNETEFPFIKSVFSYKDPLVRELVWQIKYRKNKHAVSCGAFALNTELLHISLEAPETQILLIPIPISKSRRKERGYNQTESIVQEIIKINQNLTSDFNLLQRVKDVEKQTFKNRKERIENSSQIFKINKDQLEIIDRNLKIIIIDDVTTTGSTIKEARQTFVDEGFKDVVGLTIAH